MPKVDRISFRGGQYTYREVSEITGVHVNTLRHRMSSNTPLDAPKRDYSKIEYQGRMMSANEISEITGMNHHAIKLRLDRGLPIDTEEVERVSVDRAADFDIDGKMADECVDEVVERHPDGLTLEQVAILVGKTRERIRQIQNQAIAKLRAASKKRKLSADMQLLLDAVESLDAPHRVDPLDALPTNDGFYWGNSRRQKKAG